MNKLEAVCQKLDEIESLLVFEFNVKQQEAEDSMDKLTDQSVTKQDIYRFGRTFLHNREIEEIAYLIHQARERLNNLNKETKEDIQNG